MVELFVDPGRRKTNIQLAGATLAFGFPSRGKLQALYSYDKASLRNLKSQFSLIAFYFYIQNICCNISRYHRPQHPTLGDLL